MRTARMFNKEIFRSITHSLGRFVAIAAIAALGAGFYAGLRSTAPDMDLAADVYYDDTHLMDLRVVSTLGLTDADVAALRELDAVDQVMPAYEADVLAVFGESRLAMRVHSLPAGALESSCASGTVISSDEGYLNRLLLTGGRWPVAPGECVISGDKVMNDPMEIGDTIRITDCTTSLESTLKQTEYTIVGFVRSPYYVCGVLGPTSLGSGMVDQFLFVPEDDFADSLPYTEAFLTVKGAAELRNGSDEYRAAVDRAIGQIEGIGSVEEARRTAELRAQAQAELDAKWDEYERAAQEAKGQLGDAWQQLEAGRAQLDATAQQLAEAEAQLAEGRAELDAAWAQLEQVRASLDTVHALLDALETRNLTTIATAMAGLDLKGLTAVIIQKGIGALGKSVQEVIADLMTRMMRSIEGVLTGGTIENAREDIKAAIAPFEEQYQAGVAEYQAGLGEYEAGLSALQAGRAQYQAGLAEFERRSSGAWGELRVARDQLMAAQAQIDGIARAEWYLLDRTKIYGAESFSNDTQRVDRIASIFPLVFFLVAALVSLTTMTRMVEEERVLIGTYKALGYSRGRITSKYLLYAASASIVGAVIGIALLTKLLPFVIMRAYNIFYMVPAAGYPVNWPLAVLSAGFGVGIVLLATWGAAFSALREKPAALMLPRAPKAGKRILLERVAPVWKRTSFTWKVTFRNLFRYKKRLVMTVIGIAGCTALLLTGWGLRDSINDILNLHFGRIARESVTIAVDPGMTAGQRAQVDELLNDGERGLGCFWEHRESVLAKRDGAGNLMVDLIALDANDAGASASGLASGYADFHVLQTRVSGKPLTLQGLDGAIVVEKLANLLGLSVGDELRLYGQDVIGNATDEYRVVKVAGICESYVGNTVFISNDVYRSVWHREPVANTVIAKVSESPEDHAQLSAALRQVPGVASVGYMDQAIDTYRTMLKSVDAIVWVLVIAAAVLAFVVVYNLTNINITERMREIATLKVLGFTPREVQAYIYREVALLAVIGALLGLVLGVFLEGFVVTTAEVEQVMFGRTIHLFSFAISFVLTIVFTLLVMLFMRRKLSAVNMAESLKSIE